jgi:hypothetical protein
MLKGKPSKEFAKVFLRLWKAESNERFDRERLKGGWTNEAGTIFDDSLTVSSIAATTCIVTYRSTSGTINAN